MSKTGLGLFQGVPAVRIAFNNSTDLVNEPAASFGKFQLDTVNGTKLSYIYDIYTQGYDSRYDNGGSTKFYQFANNDLNTVINNNSNTGTAAAYILWNSTAQGQQDLYMFDTWWPWGYLPVVEYRDRTGATAGHFSGPSVAYVASGGVGTVTSQGAYTGNTKLVTNSNASPFYRDGYDLTLQTSTNSSKSTFTWQLSVLQLPQRNVARPDYSAAPVSGQQVFLMNPTTMRLALAGRTVTDTNPDHYTFHENKIPAKVMRAGDIALPGSGTVDIICPLPLTEFTYMDWHVKKQTDTEFWHPPFYNGVSSAGNYGISYFVDIANQKVTVTNSTSTALTIRYIIFADSEDAYTTGGKKVFYKGNDGTRDFIQAKRPGSSDVAPKLNDIIFDSRLAYLPILAEGFLNWSTDFPTTIAGSDLYKGEKMATISIANPSPSLKLFCKTIVVFPSPTTPNGSQSGVHKVFTDGGAGSWIGRASCDSCWANIHAAENGVDLYMSGDNPLNITFNGSTGTYTTTYPQKVVSNSFSNTSALGVRYYIFGIPNSL